MPTQGRKGNFFFTTAIIVVVMVGFVPHWAEAEFEVAITTADEVGASVAYNPQTGEFLVAYLERQTNLPGQPYELRVKRFKNGVQQGGTLQPLGSGSHVAIGRPAMAYSPNANRFLVAVPERVQNTDRVIARFLDGNGNNLPGPDFLFTDVWWTYYLGSGGGSSLRIAHNSLLDEFVVTVQRTIAGNNEISAQRISYAGGRIGSVRQLAFVGTTGLNSHAIAFSPVPAPAGRYLFGYNGVSLLDSDLNLITAVPLHMGEPEGQFSEYDIAYGEVQGQRRFLLVYSDRDNCQPGRYPCQGTLFEWSGVWGTYLDPLKDSYSGAVNTPFPISKIYSHIAAEPHSPRVAFNSMAKAFLVTWRELPGKDADGENLSHIRGNWVDYFVADGLYKTTLVKLPHKNIVISDVTGSCQTAWPYLCLSEQDPKFPDACPAGDSSMAVVWQQQSPANSSDLNLIGDLMRGGVYPSDRIGCFRGNQWFLDVNGNGKWDTCTTDFCRSFGYATDVPLAGDWKGSGKAAIGVKRAADWYLDNNGTGAWEGCAADWCYHFGFATDLPVIGDWNGFGSDKIGVFRKGKWYLDYNGNGVWNGCGTDLCIASFGLPTDIPVAGDWNGDGQTEIGVFRNGTWYLDYNGSGTWNGCGVDKCYTFGLQADLPVVGDWNGNGYAKIGVKRGTGWYLDYNGNGIWNGCATDRCYTFGLAADKPVAGNW